MGKEVAWRLWMLNKIIVFHVLWIAIQFTERTWKRYVVVISCFLTGKEVYSQFRTNWSAIYLFANNFTICLDISPYFFGLKQLQYCIWAVIYTRVFLIKLRNLSSCVTICKYRSWNSVILHACWSQVHCRTPVFLSLGSSRKGNHAHGYTGVVWETLLYCKCVTCTTLFWVNALFWTSQTSVHVNYYWRDSGRII